ncbi:MAG TPA: hypothetical protein VIC85_15045 [Ktedonobacterales bacterium]|jgi:hypothetical protein
MTTNLEKALDAAAKLPKDEQDILAEWLELLLRHLASQSRRDRALAAPTKLPNDDGGIIAEWLLRHRASEQLASEQRWDQAFAESADALESLADEALAEHRAGRTVPLDPDTL